MRRVNVLLWVVSTFLIVGCGQDGKAPKGEASKDQGAGSVESVEEKTAETVKAAADLANRNREAFQREIEAKLQRLDKQIGELQAQADKAGAKLKEDTKDAIAKLEEKKASARKKLAALKSAGTEAWEDLKTGMSEAVEELEEAYEQARGRFSS